MNIAERTGIAAAAAAVTFATAFRARADRFPDPRATDWDFG